MQSKKLYKCQAFSWVYGERKVHKERYVYAHSPQQAIYLAFRRTVLNDSWSVNAEEVRA